MFRSSSIISFGPPLLHLGTTLLSSIMVWLIVVSSCSSLLLSSSSSSSSFNCPFYSSNSGPPRAPSSTPSSPSPPAWPLLPPWPCSPPVSAGEEPSIPRNGGGRRKQPVDGVGRSLEFGAGSTASAARPSRPHLSRCWPRSWPVECTRCGGEGGGGCPPTTGRRPWCRSVRGGAHEESRRVSQFANCNGFYSREA